MDMLSKYSTFYPIILHVITEYCKSTTVAFFNDQSTTKDNKDFCFMVTVICKRAEDFVPLLVFFVDTFIERKYVFGIALLISNLKSNDILNSMCTLEKAEEISKVTRQLYVQCKFELALPEIFTFSNVFKFCNRFKQ
ncbi:hypothetical protein GEMRC1_001461 [Eukaryota sp. GEM-RC1]